MIPQALRRLASLNALAALIWLDAWVITEVAYEVLYGARDRERIRRSHEVIDRLMGAGL